MPDFKIIIIGGGVVGLAIAQRLSKKHHHILLLEKHERCGMETSSRNSEVIHAGIYYRHGSLKAAFCVQGREELCVLCSQNNIPYRKITKIISAANETVSTNLWSIIIAPLLHKAQWYKCDAKLSASKRGKAITK